MAIQACGVCHTDLHYREGGINDDFPFLLGHEAAGIVESVGEGVTEVAPGDYVILNWRAVCGDCRACRRGQAAVLLQHAQRHPEDDAARRHRAVARARHRCLLRQDARRRRAVHEGRSRRAGHRGRAARLRRDGRHRRGDQHRRASRAASRSPCSAAAASAMRRSPAPVSPARPRSSPSTSTTASSSGPRGSAPPTPCNSTSTDPVESIQVGHRRLRRRRVHRGGRQSRGLPAGVRRPRSGRHGRARRRAPPRHDASNCPFIEVFGRGGALKSSWYGDCLPEPRLPDARSTSTCRAGSTSTASCRETIGLDAIEEAFHKMERGEVLRSVVVL